MPLLDQDLPARAQQGDESAFAVIARDGTPRTMFKPDDGAAYWAEQKAKAPDFGRRRTDG